MGFEREKYNDIFLYFFHCSPTGSSIKCYSCHGLAEDSCSKSTLRLNHDKYIRACKGGLDRCMRVWQKINDLPAFVQNLCTNERLCDKTEKACDKLKDEGYKCAVSCCHDNACNSADFGVWFNPYMVIMCIAVCLIQAFI